MVINFIVATNKANAVAKVINLTSRIKLKRMILLGT